MSKQPRIISDGAHRSGLMKDYGGQYNPVHQCPVVVSGIWLRSEGGCAVVLVERDGKWTEIIRESLDSAFSHMAEPSVIRQLSEDR